MVKGATPPEPDHLDIEFMPLPPVFVKRKHWRWETLLNPVRAAPGSTARIRTHAKEANAKQEVRRIKARLEEVCPHEKWEFNVLHLRDESANVGVFATYRGILTEAERHEQAILRKQYSERSKRAAVKRKLNKEAREAVDNVTLIRPRGRYG